MPVINLKKTGNKIRLLMFQTGISAKAIQDKLGFTTTNAVYKWMNGQSLPSLNNLLVLAELFGVKMEDMLGIEYATEEI